jgi:hypothetical protein
MNLGDKSDKKPKPSTPKGAAAEDVEAAKANLAGGNKHKDGKTGDKKHGNGRKPGDVDERGKRIFDREKTSDRSVSVNNIFFPP